MYDDVLPPPDDSFAGSSPDPPPRRSLSDGERRLAAFLGGRTAPIDLLDLAATVAPGDGTGDDDHRTLERVAIALHHVHVPKLADVGVLAYDAETTRIDAIHVDLSRRREGPSRTPAGGADPRDVDDPDGVDDPGGVDTCREGRS
jgi:hypothetical protein